MTTADRDVCAKFDVLQEDLREAASLAQDLKQNTIASVLMFQIVAILHARQGHVDEAISMMKEMSDACAAIVGKYYLAK